jgi:hypothetical protein
VPSLSASERIRPRRRVKTSYTRPRTSAVRVLVISIWMENYVSSNLGVWIMERGIRTYCLPGSHKNTWLEANVDSNPKIQL